jgi:hypothetical protein
MKLHRPRIYRYEVSKAVQRRRPRVGLNRYGLQVIGAAVVVGQFAYCAKWAWAT